MLKTRRTDRKWGCFALINFNGDIQSNSMNKINNRNKREENVDNKTGKVFEVDLWARCWMIQA